MELVGEWVGSCVDSAREHGGCSRKIRGQDTLYNKSRKRMLYVSMVHACRSFSRVGYGCDHQTIPYASSVEKGRSDGLNFLKKRWK